MTAPQTVTVASAATMASAQTAWTVQQAIRARLLRDVVKLWPMLDVKRLDETFPGWVRAMTLLTRTYHGQSATAAARLYRQMRAQAVGVGAPDGGILTPPAPSDEWLTKAYGFSGPGQLTSDVTRPNTALSTTMGTAARIVQQGGRDTVVTTEQADPEARGWFRMTDADPCPFCALLASRLAVYSEGSVRFNTDGRFEGGNEFAAHNLCGCVGVPEFGTGNTITPIAAQAAEVYSGMTRERGQSAMTAFRQAWINRDRTPVAA